MRYILIMKFNKSCSLWHICFFIFTHNRKGDLAKLNEMFVEVILSGWNRKISNKYLVQMILLLFFFFYLYIFFLFFLFLWFFFLLYLIFLWSSLWLFLVLIFNIFLILWMNALLFYLFLVHLFFFQLFCHKIFFGDCQI